MIKPALDIRPGKRHRLTLYLQRSMQVLQASSQALQKEVDCGPGYSTPIVQLDVRKMIESEPLREAPQRPRDQLDTARQRDPSRTLYRHKISRTHVHSAFYATVKSALPPPGRLH